MLILLSKESISTPEQRVKCWLYFFWNALPKNVVIRQIRSSWKETDRTLELAVAMCREVVTANLGAWDEADDSGMMADAGKWKTTNPHPVHKYIQKPTYQPRQCVICHGWGHERWQCPNNNGKGNG